ncbi:hypothetical protein [Quadrisphaera sp. KR29]|uniref:hypothetical protein n=1 Tax=Quadrisphaera sp. KR29 TaxID=3461391 RepID=UPI0040448BF6
MSTPSFIDRLRSRSRRPGPALLLGAAPPPLLETSPGPLPEDHWHAGDPRLLPPAPASAVQDVPSPRRPVDRRGLTVVPEVDLRADVVDLRGDGSSSTRAAPVTPATAPAPGPDAPCSEPSTWLG